MLLKRGYVSPRSDKAAFCKQYLSSKLFRRNCNCAPNSYGNSVCKLYPRLKFLDTRYPRLSQNLPPAMETKSNWSGKETESYVGESVAPVLRKLVVEFHSERESMRNTGYRDKPRDNEASNVRWMYLSKERKFYNFTILLVFIKDRYPPNWKRWQLSYRMYTQKKSLF